MPFTFSHPAIVLPLTYLPRHWYSLTGLIVGSLMPDFEYFFRMKVKSEYSHTLPGLFFFNLPLGLAVAFLFHNIVRNSLFNNLPLFMRLRLYAFMFDWNRYFRSNWSIVICSVFIGSASHLFWDSFTHEDGFFVRIIPALATSMELSNSKIPVFKMLQHLSTLFGGVVLTVTLVNLPANHKVEGQVNLKYWLIFVVMTLGVIAMRFLLGSTFITAYGHLIVTAIAAALIALTLTPLLLQQKTN